MERRYIIAKRRSEQGKLIRRLYKNDLGVPYQLCKGYSLMLDGYSNTITTFTTDNWILELQNNDNMENLVYHEHPTKEQLLEYFGQRIRVRKMTPKTAFRLMDVDDADIEKIQAYPFASWGSFVSMLTYKAEWNDKKVVKIDRYFPSSQTCNVCGYINKQTKDLSVREWECPVCQTHHNRDVNAAINILRFGLNHISAGTVDYTGGEEVRANLLKGRSSAKPEAHESLAHG